jgi:hypothetical protein
MTGYTAALAHGNPTNLAAAPEIITACPPVEERATLRSIFVYEHGCGFPHDDVEARYCTDCHNVGFSIEEAEPQNIL